MKSKDFAYWVGVAQSDGYFKKYQYIKKSNKHLITRYTMRLCVSKKSLPMLLKFKRITEVLFNKKIKEWHNYKYNNIEFNIGIKPLLLLFKKLDINFFNPPKPPKWCIKNNGYFGAYLAGIIDGDGNIRVRRPKYPQCTIRIFSNKSSIRLVNSIKKNLKCGVSNMQINKWRIIRGKRTFTSWNEIEFCVTYKNYEFVEKYIIPHLALNYKKEKLINFIEIKIKNNLD